MGRFFERAVVLDFFGNGRNVSNCLNKGETTEIKDFLMSSTELIDFL